MKNAIIISLIMLSVISCKKVAITKSRTTNMHKQIFYTQEGSAYVVKSFTTNGENLNIVAPMNVVLNVEINYPDSGIPGRLNFVTSKRIVPISAGTYFTKDPTGISPSVKINITSVYYRAIRGISPISKMYNQQNSQLKLWPFVEQIFLTDDAFYSFGVKYNEAVFNDGDFIDPSSGMILQFSNNKTVAFTGIPQGSPVVPDGSYNVSTNFVYLEML